MPSTVTITARIENVYDTGTVTTTETAEVPTPPSGHEDRETWAFDHLYPLTGTGRVCGDAAYFLTITHSTEAALIGATYEWGV